MKKALLVLLFLGCGTMFAETHVSIGIGIGGYGPAYGPVYAPVPPPPPEYEVPPCPGEGYVWVDGFWNRTGGRFFWHRGYWRAPEYFGYRGGRGHGWHERGHDRDYYDRRGRDWDRGHHHDNGRNEWRHEEGRRRHEGDGWRR